MNEQKWKLFLCSIRWIKKSTTGYSYYIALVFKMILLSRFFENQLFDTYKLFLFQIAISINLFSFFWALPSYFINRFVSE